MASSQATKAQQRRRARQQKKTAAQNGQQSGKGAGSGKGRIREWFDALLFALIAALIIRTLFFEAFRIPTPSMEKNLLVGDFLLVSKLHYGPRTPITLGIPFTDIYIKGLELPFFRFPGFTDVERGDPIVFNHPPENMPIDRKTHYIKRAIGLPGDTLALINKVVHINGVPDPLTEGMQQQWIVHKTGAQVQLPVPRLDELGARVVTFSRTPGQVIIQATPGAAQAIAEWPYVARVEPAVMTAGVPEQRTTIFPSGTDFNRDNYGPLYIPKAGQTITLTDENWSRYEEVINRFEKGNVVRTAYNTFTIDGQPGNQYTFTRDYYFAMGDNRDDSADSRAWGFVPDNHLVGRAFLIYFSWDMDRKLPRFSRLFNLIKGY